MVIHGNTWYTAWYYMLLHGNTWYSMILISAGCLTHKKTLVQSERSKDPTIMEKKRIHSTQQRVYAPLFFIDNVKLKFAF